MRRALLLLALGCVIAAGCGGSTGAGVGSLTTVMSQIHKNWERTYQVVGFFTPNGGQQEVASGTLVENYTNRVGTQVTETRTLMLTVGGVTNTYITTVVLDQAVDGSLTEVSTTVDSNPTLTVQSTNFSVPGTWSATTNSAGITTYTDASVQTNSLIVTGSTQVSVPVGTMDAWTTNYAETYQGNPVETLTEYFVPSIDGFIYAQGTKVLTDGVFNGSFSLELTNIPLP